VLPAEKASTRGKPRGTSAIGKGSAGIGRGKMQGEGAEVEFILVSSLGRRSGGEDLLKMGGGVKNVKVNIDRGIRLP